MKGWSLNMPRDHRAIYSPRRSARVPLVQCTLDSGTLHRVSGRTIPNSAGHFIRDYPM